jgi:hypothetical protein
MKKFNVYFCKSLHTTLIKKKKKFSSYIIENPEGAVAKSYMTNGLLIYDYIFVHILIYDFETAPIRISLHMFFSKRYMYLNYVVRAP